MRRYVTAAAAGLLGLAVTLLSPAPAASAPRAPQPWIAYADKVGVHLIHPDGSDGHLVVSKWGARYPSWSPNGHWLAYAQLTHDSHVTAQTSIHVLRPDGTGDRLITAGFEPSWLNAKWILFHPDASLIGIRYDPSEFAKVNVETGEVRSLQIPNLTETDYVGGGDGEWDYQLSPDRKSILWNGTAPEPADAPASSNLETLKTVSLDGSGFHSFNVTDEYWTNVGGWTPRGRAVTYPCIRAANKHKVSADLCSISIATGETTDLSARRSFAYMEEWTSPSPDGSRIVVGAGDALYVTDPSGGSFHLLFRVYTPSGNPTCPVWQP